MDKLKIINEQMAAIGIPYELGQWSSAIQYPYWVGEFTEEPITTEDGLEQSTLLLTGTNRGDYLSLETDKAKIRKHFDPICGLIAETDSGMIAVFFDGAFPVPTGEADLKRMQINLKIKEWKVN
jgi:hypothetical protein